MNHKHAFARLLLPALAAVLLARVPDARGDVAPAGKAKTQSLFNGRDLAGWRADVPALDATPSGPAPFIVRKGLLVSLGTPGGHLVTDAEHENYRLQVEYRFAGKPGNCGVLVHASKPRALYDMFPQSIEVQMQSGEAGDFWCIKEDITVPDMVARRGPKSTWGVDGDKARRIKNLTDKSEKPPGQWNQMTIECVGPEIKVWVNGDLVNHGANCTVTKGKIAIQAEGSEVEFRKIAITPIEKLSDSPPPFAAAAVDSPTAEFVATALVPFWRASEIREPLFFAEDAGQGRPSATLLFTPSEIVSVTSATRDKTFEPGKDFTADLAAGTIELPKGSTIPVITQEQLYPLMTSDLPKIGRQAGDPTRGIFFGEGAAYHQRQVEVTYRFKPGQWNGPTPTYAGDSLPKTMAKLRSKQPVNLVLCGDSISAGANASLMTNAPPGCPAYGQLTALALEHHFGSPVAFTNHAVGGWTSGNGLQQAKDQRIGKAAPDLVIIAFGMNDVFQRDAAAYQANIRGIMDAVRADAPDAEFILVASMLGNAEWGMPMEQFPRYRDALAELCGPGVVLADLTSMWEALLKRKSFYDLTGNGVNHPNDFGHCVYAQTLLALLIDERN